MNTIVSCNPSTMFKVTIAALLESALIRSEVVIISVGLVGPAARESSVYAQKASEFKLPTHQ